MTHRPVSGVAVRARRIEPRADGLAAGSNTLLRLRHGADPTVELGRAGLGVARWVSARRDDDGLLLLDCEVRDALRAPRPDGDRSAAVPHAEGLVVAAGEVAVPMQRVSALVVVRAGSDPERGGDALLLTRYSARTRRPGHWGLPGGGVEPGEDPVAAARRECWEETGHDVVLGPLLGITSDHFVGRAPHGRLEDFHAIHLVYDGRSPRAHEPEVHDVDGSTDGAAWVPSVELSGLPLTPMARRHLGLAGIAVPGP